MIGEHRKNSGICGGITSKKTAVMTRFIQKFGTHLSLMDDDFMKVPVICHGICGLLLIASITVTGYISNKKSPAMSLATAGTSPMITGDAR